MTSSKTKIVLGWIKRSPFLSTLTAFIVLNLITTILTGGFNWLGLLTNLFPTLMVFFLSSLQNENKKSNVEKVKKFM